MSAAPLRHYYAGPTDGLDVCARAGCAKPPSHPVHLTPGDEDAMNAAIRAASPHAEPTRTPEQDARAVERAAKRNAARWTFGSARSPREAG